MMKYMLLLLSVALVGCAGDRCGTGFRFEIDRPGTLNVPIPFQRGVSEFTTLPIGGVDLRSQALQFEAPYQQSARRASLCSPVPPRPQVGEQLYFPTPIDPSTRAVLDALGRIEMLLRAPPRSIAPCRPEEQAQN
jgi:hypothetical protein